MTQRIIQKFSFSTLALKYDTVIIRISNYSNIEFIVLQSAKIGLNRIFKIHIPMKKWSIYIQRIRLH